jgi:hypothetical protein
LFSTFCIIGRGDGAADASDDGLKWLKEREKPDKCTGIKE